MKKMKKVTILFIVFLMLFSANVFAYSLYVADVQITDANKNDITSAVNNSGNGTASGIITYDPTSMVLTLNNANISNLQEEGIYNRMSNLTINLLGENTINVNNSSTGIFSYQANFKITGSGSLTINASTTIYHFDCNLTIENTTVTANGANYGIRGMDGNSEILTITNSTVRATGTNSGSIRYIKSLVLNGCFISQPVGAVFNASQHAVYYNGTRVKTEIVIEPVITYDLYVANVRVTEANKDDISAAVVAAGHTATGAITFDPTSNTLTLEDANFSTSAIGIENSIANLTINLVGGNSLTSTIEDAMKLNASTKITGSGTLTATSPKAAIWHRVDTLTIENTDVTLNGENTGIGGNNNVVSINNSTVRATGTNDGSIVNINNLILNGCAITQPVDAVFNASQKAVCVNGEIVTTEVLIEPAYDLRIAGVQITPANKDDITAAVVDTEQTGVTASGTITYNPSTNTLTLDNASINANVYDGIHNEIENLTINLLGENTINAGEAGIESDYSNFKITGSGSLTINAYLGIYHYECNLTIENTTVTATGEYNGICGYYGNNEVLSITNSTVRATGTNTASIGNINSLVLNGCAITQPAGAGFNAVQKAVCFNGTKVTTEVVIEPATTYTVSGTVKDNENNPLAGVTIAYNDGTTTTAADGTYSFTTIENTTYTVTPSKFAYTFEPTTATVNVVDADVTGIDFVGTEGEIYDLYVAGVQITDANKDNITAAVVAAGHTASGTITYNPTSNTLTLNNATITVTTNDLRAIQSFIPDLTLELIGENNVIANYISICFEASARITGNGSLTVTSTNDDALFHSRCNLTIENTTVTVNGANFGIRGYDGNNEVLSITNSTVRATGTNWGSTGNINSLVLNGCAILQPAGAVFNNYAVRANGEIVTTEILIEPAYNLQVAGVHVTPANKDDITAAIVAVCDTATGTITYDPTSNTLTLEDATITVTTNDLRAIQSFIPDLTLELIGQNNVTAKYHSICFEASATITGNGSLTVTSTDKDALFHSRCNLTIENTSVTAIGTNFGIRGYNGNNEVLSITNSTVRATATNTASIGNINSLVLNGCEILQPAGAVFNASSYPTGVCVNGTLVTTEVIIAAFPTISVSDATSCNSYTLPTSTTTDTWTWTNESNETVTDATESGVYTVVATSEFDLTATESITVTINQSVTNEITEVACGSFEWNGTTYTNSGDYSETFTAENGCDSVVTLHLTINQIVTNEITETACGSFEWNGTTYDASGDYSETFTAENGCDSVVTLHLTINQSVTNEITEIACGSFEWNGTTYDVSGDYTETFTAENGCDSVVTLHLTINQLPTVEITQEGEILTASAGMETYAWNTNETTESITISATGNYSVTVTNAAGCESTADIEVTEIPTTGINEIAVSKIAVYPNPNNGEFTINLSGIDNAISYQVIDVKGAIVKEAKVNSNEEFVSIQAKAGNYTVRVITDSKVFVEQIIVQ